MKKLTSLKPSNIAFVAALSFILGLFNSIQTFAQSVPEQVDVNVNAGGDSAWYGQPWVWAIGVALFIVIIIAITRGNRNNA